MANINIPWINPQTQRNIYWRNPNPAFSETSNDVAYVTDNYVYLPRRCQPYKYTQTYAESLNQLIPEIIERVYHNGKGGDFIIYKNGTVVDYYPGDLHADKITIGRWV